MSLRKRKYLIEREQRRECADTETVALKN